ncbi:MAG: AAA family ATPase, partial [Chitinophagales bacterium]
MKLKSIYIKGFKDPEREINLEFSDEPITVIYGVNGSGKTTLLRVISGILSRDSRILEKENVERVKLRYEQEGKDFECIVSRKNEGFSWSEEADLFNDSTSILFGTDRGV